MLAGINQEGADPFRESAILGPARDDPTSRIAKQDFDSLFARETQFRRTIAAIRQGDVNGQLADFRELNRFRREFYRSLGARSDALFELTDGAPRGAGVPDGGERPPIFPSS